MGNSLETKERDVRNLAAGDQKPVYVLYNWQGACKWGCLLGVCLVDPRYEQEFLNAQDSYLA